MKVYLNRLAVGSGYYRSGYYLCWYTPILGNEIDHRRHEEHLGTEKEFKAIAKAFGWTPDIGKTAVEYLEMATDDSRQDISDTIDVFELPNPWREKILSTYPDLPDIFVFKNDDSKFWMGWTERVHDGYLINHQMRLDTPELLMQVAEGFGWEYEGEDDPSDSDALDYLEDFVFEETQANDGESPERPTISFPLDVQRLVAASH